MFQLGNENIADEVALELEKDDAYQSDSDEEDFRNFTYVFKETDWKFSFTFRYQFHNSSPFLKRSFNEKFNKGKG